MRKNHLQDRASYEPRTCNVYQELHFPDGIYENISNFYEEQVEAEGKRS